MTTGDERGDGALRDAARLGLVVLIFDQVNAYQAQALDGIRRVLVAAGVPHLLYVNDPFARRLRSPVKRLLSSLDVRGCITTMLTDPESHADLEETITQSGLPFVHIGSPVPGGTSVGIDNASGMTALMAHLLDEVGARRIALVRGPSHHPDSLERETVVRRELQARALALAPELVVEGKFDRDAAYAATCQLLRGKPDIDAIVALNDRSALGVLDALRESGLRVPQDVVVTGFDDDDIARQAGAGLTTVSQGLFAMGGHAAELLLQRMAGAPPHGHQTLPATLVTRGSSSVTGQGPADEAEQRTFDQAQALAALERGLAINRGFMACRSMTELLTEVGASIRRLSLNRCLIVLNDEREGMGSVVLQHPLAEGHPQQYSDPFSLDTVLPVGLQPLLSKGAWTMQPLSVDGHDLGYVLFEQSSHDPFVGELLRMDLSRAIDSLQTNARHAASLEAHARSLEELVAVRTAELRTEIASRTAAELELLQANLELIRLAKVDIPTGVANRAAFDSYVAEQWSAHQDAEESLSLLLIDVDYFKERNDQFGHLSGDACLRRVGQCLRDALWSPVDLAARYGGDEFVAVLPNTDHLGALAVAHRVHRAIRAMRPTEDGPAPTVSIGLATMTPPPGSDPNELIAAADAALYCAKSSGRDRVSSDVRTSIDRAIS